MAKRLPSEPPVLPGYAFIRPLGTGGFSDVFLYEQDLPRREVAVKVMLPDSGDTDIAKMFTTEADALAKLSAHHSILSVFGASRAADGRPYLVMEHCPESYARAFREFVLSVPEVLDVGIRIAGALESVHRAGLLHRDVKPANILKTTAGTPVLSDFGVAATRYFGLDEDRIAMSIPWSAPEIVNESVVGSVSTDVWSLGATVYSLLAGRSPFEQSGEGANTAEQLKKRIRKAKYTVIAREDVPDELEQILARALSLQPASRQSSALILGQQLQGIQRDLGLAITELEVIGDDSMSASIDTLARGEGRIGRLPEPSVVERTATVRQDARRARLTETSKTRPARQQGLDDVPGSERVPRLSARAATILAVSGVAALILAVAIVLLGR